MPRGQTFGLLGPNGAGKTTLVKLMLAIAFPTAGSAAVLGRPPGDVRAKERIGYLPENHRYPAHLTGEQVLHHFGRLSGLRREVRAPRVEALLRRVGMEAWRSVRVHKYSKGMMQRLGLAQAILNEPDLLILDEPTDGVDPIGRKEIRDLLLEQRDRGATIFLNSHLLSEVERVCDRVAIVKEGALLREGQVSDLTRPRSLWQIDIRPAPPAAFEAAVASLPDYHPPPVYPAAGVRRAAAAPPVPPPVAAGTASPPVAAPTPGAGGGEPFTRVELSGDVAVLNSGIDALRRHGIEIVSVVPRRDSLEDVFVRVLEEGEPQ